MGSLLSCDRCYTRETISVITFSEGVVLRYADGIELEEEKQNKNELDLSKLPDADWFLRIKCIDDAHSQAYGLTMKSFDRLCRKLERQLTEGMKDECRREEVMDCYKAHPSCSLACQHEAETFVGCVDLSRLKAIKKQVDKRRGFLVDEDEDDY